MKRLFITTLAVLIAVSASAASTTQKPKMPQQCPFTDNFYLAGATIQNLSGSNLTVTKIDPTYFTTGCYNNIGNDGYAYLTAVGSNGSLCNLTIEDGPYEQNPIVVSSNCQGNMQFAGMDHSYGTYDYSLKFTS